MEQATATFLFTDVEGSTRLLKLLRDTYRPVLAEHGALIETAVTEHRGMVVDTQGRLVLRSVPTGARRGACRRRRTARARPPRMA